MNILIYLIIALLFAVLIFWTWNNTKEFEETSERIIYIIVGIAVVAIVTLIYFAISKIDKVNDFLTQGVDEKYDFEEEMQLLQEIFQ